MSGRNLTPWEPQAGRRFGAAKARSNRIDFEDVLTRSIRTGSEPEPYSEAASVVEGPSAISEGGAGVGQKAATSAPATARARIVHRTAGS